MSGRGPYLLAALGCSLGLGTYAQGDLCTGATALVCGSTVAGSTLGYGADVAPFCGTGDGTGGGVWYTITGSGTEITASLCGSGYDTKIRVYTGACTGLVCVVGNDDFCGLGSQVTWTGASGVVYRILVHGFGAAQGNYTLAITCPPPPSPMCYETTATPYMADPHAGTAVTLSDDVHSGVVPIGFTFCYNGVNYTQCVISSNNYITFDLSRANTYSPWVTVAVPNTAPVEVRNSILNPWQDIHPGVGGSIRYQTVGTAPYRRFVVSYLNVPMFSCTSQQYSSQTILYEGSNCIGAHILSKPICTSWNSGNAVHALHNPTGTAATVVFGRNNTQWTAASQGLLFTPTCGTCMTPASLDCLPIILPIELLSFTGHRDGLLHRLEWSTGSERNSALFVVERSSDLLQWSTVAEVAAAGNSSSLRTYRATDAFPLPGTNHYRLRSVDVDGGFSLSEVVAIAADAQAPNVHYDAAGDLLHVALTGGEGTVELVLLDASGRALRQARPAAEGLVQWSMAGVPDGVYLVRVQQPGGSRTVRVVLAR